MTKKTTYIIIAVGVILGVILAFSLNSFLGGGGPSAATNVRKAAKSSNAQINNDNTKESSSEEIGKKDVNNLKEPKMAKKDSESKPEPKSVSKKYVPKNKNAIIRDGVIYDCDIEKDKKEFDGHIDIHVGLTLFCQQINDWYMYSDKYEGKTVEVPGFILKNYPPYQYIGRKGVGCPYCGNGTIYMEIITNENLDQYASGKDWVNLKGILRKGYDPSKGPFVYIEVLSIERQPKPANEETI